ncbi:MAG: DUF4392 domain-containing protein [Planctomycetota bacterium]|nr:MAG: DUF4392 domain-containing protein [Planctomycetota bacterium]
MRSVHRDPGGRGLASFLRDGRPLDDGDWPTAAHELASRARHVAIVTGFCVVLPDRVTAETDGPPGALFLAQTLLELGVNVTVVTDRVALPVVKCGMRTMGIDRGRLLEFPAAATIGADEATIDTWMDTFLGDVTHLIAIERPGPSHTIASLTAALGDTSPALERFVREVPHEHHGRCHTMRGAIIDEHTAPVHRLFEAAGARPNIATIGIGDGGNEIGMGRFGWEDVVAAIPSPVGPRIACRTPTDLALVAGTSNWAAYGLALATAAQCGKRPTSRWLGPEGQRELIEQLVTAAGAVDGCTALSTPTVDGLSLDAFLQPLEELWSQLDA